MSMFGASRDEVLTTYSRGRTKRRDVVVEQRKVDVFSSDYSGKDEFEYSVFIESGVFRKTRTAVHTFRTPAGGLAFVSGEGDDELQRDIERCVEFLTTPSTST